MKPSPLRRSLSVFVALSAMLLAGCGGPMQSGEGVGSAQSSADDTAANEASADAARGVEPVSDVASTTDTLDTGAGGDGSPSPATTPTSPAAPAATGPVDITFDDVQFEMDREKETFQRSMLGDQVEDLLGRKILIRGYILPSFQQSGITQFVLVRDNQECCFGPNAAALYDCMIVEMAPGKSADYTIRPVTVEGTFTLRELKGPDGKHLAIYHVDGESVR